MDAALAALPNDVDALKLALLAARADVAAAVAEQSSNRALIAHLKLQIEKLNRDRFGPRSERTARLLDQMELQLEELEATATEDELAAEIAAAKITHVAGFTRARPTLRPFPITCRASALSCPAPQPAPAAAAPGCPSSGRTSPKPSKSCPAPGRSSSMCVRSSPVAIASASASRQRRST